MRYMLEIELPDGKIYDTIVNAKNPDDAVGKSEKDLVKKHGKNKYWIIKCVRLDNEGGELILA